MIIGLSPAIQALLATMFTWGVTALGASLVFLVPRGLSERRQRMLLDGALGFAAGVMLAASYWSLLAPALEFAEASGKYGAHSYLPVGAGLLLGAGFVFAADCLIPHGAGDAVTVLTHARESGALSKKQDGYGSGDEDTVVVVHRDSQQLPPLTRTTSMNKRNASSGRLSDEAFDEMEAHRSSGGGVKPSKLKQSPPPPHAPGSTRTGSRKKGSSRSGSARISEMLVLDEDHEYDSSGSGGSLGRTLPTGSSSVSLTDKSAANALDAVARAQAQSWHRILLLVIAIVIHNFPEGLAVGVGFGALATVQPTGEMSHEEALSMGGGIYNASLVAEAEAARAESYASRFAEARTLAFGIGLQNFPEGLAVSLPLLRVGYSRSTAFWYGQLSGMVEPVGGLLGAALIGFMQPMLPYALAFAAGAMIFVVVEDLIPETRAPGGFPTLASGCVMIGFVVMMAMDVGLG